MLQGWFPGSENLVLLATEIKKVENFQIPTSFCVRWAHTEMGKEAEFSRAG